MHPLKRAMRQESENLQDWLPEDAKAGKCLIEAMDSNDWNTLHSLDSDQPSECAQLVFVLLRTFLVNGSLPVDSGQPEYSMPTADIRRQASNLAKQLRQLSREIESFFPELSQKKSLKFIIQPESWLERTRSLEPTMQECVEDSIKYMTDRGKPPSRDPTVLDVMAGMARASENEAAATKTYNTWINIVQSMDSGITSLCNIGIAPPVVGEGSVLEKIVQYITDHAETKKSPRKPRNNPSWCRHFCTVLDNKFESTPPLSDFKRSQKLRVIEFMLHAHAAYHGLHIPSSWGIREIERSLP